ncbi:MAG: XRE family transcriptional regulator [Bacteroidales bacterium]|nr:XRE family transcriptional regulator [Bacteroidales bacterium]
MENTAKVGARVMAIRETKNMTREHVSERTGLSVEQLKRIEEQQNMPSLSPLIKIARALGVRLGTFLDDQEAIGPVVCRACSEADGVSFSSQNSTEHRNIVFHALAQDKAGRHMEPFFLDVDAASKEHMVLSSHEGEEFLYVLSGSIEITYGTQVYVLNSGESIYYDSIVEHNVHSANGQEAKVLAVVYTPF